MTFSRLSSKTLDALDVSLQSAAVTDPLQPEPHDVSPADIDADQTAGGAADIDTEPVAQVVPLVVPSSMQGTSPDYVSLAKLIPPDVRQKARAGDRDETDRTPTNAKVPASKHTAGTAVRHPR